MCPDGGATTLTSVGGEDGFVSQWDAAGNVQWIQSLATGAGDLMPGQLALGPDGGLLIGYGFDGAADFDPGPGVASLISTDEIDGAVVKLNADGSFAWARQLAGPGTTWASGIVVDALGFDECF